MQRNAQTAILTVTNFGGLGIHSLLNQFRIFPNQFKQIVFVSVGAIDSGRFKGADEIESLRKSTETELQKYVDFAREARVSRRVPLLHRHRHRGRAGGAVPPGQQGLSALGHVRRAARIPEEGAVVRWLHNQTCPALQRRLAFHGLPMVILPVRVY